MSLNSEVIAIALALDKCFDDKDVSGTYQNIEKANELLKNDKASELNIASLHYSIGTAYSDLKTHLSEPKDYKEKEELDEKALYHLRFAIDIMEQKNYDIKDLDECVIHQPLYTNAANHYANHGRYIEALRLYEVAQKYSLFPMAIAHQGFKALKFSLNFYDVSQSQHFCHYAYWAMGEALKYKEHLHHMEFMVEELELTRQSLLDFFGKDFLDGAFEDSHYGYGNTKHEKEYKTWCALEKLFLNPLNEITSNSITAHDFIHLPNMRYNIGDKKDIFHFGLFNQIIQEYVSARFLFYDGTKIRNKAQDADKNVLLVEVEYNVTSHADFCIRTAFKTLYSILDRIAYFMNDYFDLNIPVQKVSFRSIWDDKILNASGKKGDNPLKEKIQDNEMLNAIYWLSKDIFEKEYTSTKPRSKKINTLRNRIEHRYVVSTLVDYDLVDDGLSYFISTVELYNLTLDMLNIVRETIIYLSLAIHKEEQNKISKDKEKKFVVHMQHNVMKDDWK